MKNKTNYGVACLWLVAGVAMAAPQPIVIGQSLPNGAGSYRATVELSQGARAYVGYINAAGGVKGRPIKLVSLDGGNDPAAHAENVRTLVREHGAVAIIGCGGDSVCLATAAAANEMHVPLIGALSGLKAMGRDASPYFFPLRPNYEREAEAIATQMNTLAITRAAILTDAGASSEKVLALQRAMQSRNIRQTIFSVAMNDAKAVDKAVAGIEKGDFQTVLMDVGPDMVDVLAERKVGESAVWPRTLMSLASSSFQGVGNIFPGKALGFTQLVPNPETDNIPLTFDMLRHAEAYASGKAINFDGMAAYMATKLAVEAIRRAGSRVDGESVATALATAGSIDLGGYSVSFAKGRTCGSDRVTLGVRSRTGQFLK